MRQGDKKEESGGKEGRERNECTPSFQHASRYKLIFSLYHEKKKVNGVKVGEEGKRRRENERDRKR